MKKFMSLFLTLLLAFNVFSVLGYASYDTGTQEEVLSYKSLPEELVKVAEDDAAVWPERIACLRAKSSRRRLSAAALVT